jgi:chemotaxis protein CheD
MFDRQRSLGGMGHYLHPRRMGSESTSIFAAPALVELLNMFIQAGSRLDRLETFVYGGSDNPEVASNEFGRGGLNLRAGLEILTKLGVRVAGTDIGGRYARRLVFYTATGESVVAKVTDVLSADAWYPRLGGGSTLGRQS